jgi:hypothetical protein
MFCITTFTVPPAGLAGVEVLDGVLEAAVLDVLEEVAGAGALVLALELEELELDPHAASASARNASRMKWKRFMAGSLLRELESKSENAGRMASAEASRPGATTGLPRPKTLD